jgi:hypothetical protein
MQHIYELADNDRSVDVLDIFQPLWDHEMANGNTRP